MREAIAFGVALVKLRIGVAIPTWNAKVTQDRADRLEGSRGPIREDSFNCAQKLTWTRRPSPIEDSGSPDQSKADNRSKSEIEV